MLSKDASTKGRVEGTFINTMMWSISAILEYVNCSTCSMLRLETSVAAITISIYLVSGFSPKDLKASKKKDIDIEGGLSGT